MISSWNRLPGLFPGIQLDALVVMPDHVHAIIWLPGCGALINQGPTNQGPTNQGPTGDKHQLQPMMADPRMLLGKVVRAWKASSTNHIRRGGLLDFRWQSRYYEHVIRNGRALANIRRYIAMNPERDETPRGNS